MFHDEVACFHVEGHMIMGVGLFSCMLCDDVACLHVEMGLFSMHVMMKSDACMFRDIW